MADQQDLSKLPKWAQSKIKSLEDQLAGARSEISGLMGSTETSIEVDPYRDMINAGAPRTFLLDNVRVRYTIPGGSIMVGLRDGLLEIQAEDWAFNAEMTLRSRASNVVWVGFDLAHFKKERADVFDKPKA